MKTEIHAWVVLNRLLMAEATEKNSAFADRVATLLHHELPVRMKRLEKGLMDENWAFIREESQFLNEAATDLKCNVIPGLCRLVIAGCDAAARPIVPVCNLIEFVRILIIELKTFSNQESSVLKLENT